MASGNSFVNRVLHRYPVYHVVRCVHPRFWRYYLLLTVVVGLCCLQLAKIAVPSVQLTFLRQFHFKNRSFSRWAVQQMVPTMYSFGNELWWDRHPLTQANLFYENEDITQRYYLWLNHFPLHFATYNHYRDLFFMGADTHYIVMRSRFRGLEMISCYRMKNRRGELLLGRYAEGDLCDGR